MRVNDGGLVVITAALPGDELVEGERRDGTGGRVRARSSAGDAHLESTAPEGRSLARVLRSRLAEVG